MRTVRLVKRSLSESFKGKRREALEKHIIFQSSSSSTNYIIVLVQFILFLYLPAGYVYLMFKYDLLWVIIYLIFDCRENVFT